MTSLPGPGTQDFVDQAVDVMSSGRQPFLLVALNHNGKGQRSYHIRSGTFTVEDTQILRSLCSGEVAKYLRDEEREYDQDA